MRQGGTGSTPRWLVPALAVGAGLAFMALVAAIVAFGLNA